MIVTIDGPAGAGKSTVSALLARRLGLPCLNSGAIYRAVTALLLEKGHGDDPYAGFVDRIAVLALLRGLRLEFEDDGAADEVPRTRVYVVTGGRRRDLTDRLKLPEVTAEIWRVANDPEYRRALRDMQRAFGDGAGVVAEGRDMGTVIFPDADAKFFLDASAEERARRQHEEALAAGRSSDYEALLRSVIERDARDRQRAESPLAVPDDAVVVQTEGLGAAEVVDVLEGLLRSPELRSDERSGPPR